MRSNDLFLMPSTGLWTLSTLGASGRVVVTLVLGELQLELGANSDVSGVVRYVKDLSGVVAEVAQFPQLRNRARGHGAHRDLHSSSG